MSVDVVAVTGETPDRPQAVRPRSRRRYRIGLFAALALLAFVALSALWPELFATHDPNASSSSETLQGPSAAHWFGTDNLGRDLYSRVVHGARLSVQATGLAVLIGLVAGSLLGLTAGFVGGVVDAIMMRVVDVLLAIPSLLLSLAVVTVMGFGTINIAVAVGVAAIAAFARLMRSEVIRIRNSLYVEAAIAGGSRWYTVVFRHVLPNSWGPVLVLAALEFGTAILAIASLSFLGYGAPPPAPEWGSLVAEGRNYMAVAWWLTTLPGLAVVAVVISANRVSRALDDLGGTR